MSAASSQQIADLERELTAQLRANASMRDKLSRVQQICHDHDTCECSAAVMILDVIGDK